jgi:peptide chain release factor subunit 1
MPVADQLAKLAAFEPAPYPVVSLYLNTQPNQTGRDHFAPFVRKELAGRIRTYPPHSPDRPHLEEDLERITTWLETELQPSANGVAIFACSVAGLFEAVQLSAPIERHWLYINDRPHLFPLARVESLYPTYAAVVADTNAARIFVFATGEVVAQEEIRGVKTRRTSQGGWSQARFQRHVENFHLQHAKEVVDALDDIVQREPIEAIVLSGDEVILPLLREQLPKHLAGKVLEHSRLDQDAPATEILQATLEAVRGAQVNTEREKVDAALGAYRAGGLGVVGPEETMEALIRGQVDELLMSASLRELTGVAGDALSVLAAADDSVAAEPVIETVAAGEPADAPPETVRLADELVTKAAQTSARITVVEDRHLLADYGGVAALLRFRI